MRESMNKIDLSTAEKWYDYGYYERRGPKHMDIRCPHAGCGKPTFSKEISWIGESNAACAEITCAGCSNKIMFYMVHPPSGKKTMEECKTLIYQHI